MQESTEDSRVLRSSTAGALGNGGGGEGGSSWGIATKNGLEAAAGSRGSCAAVGEGRLRE